MSFIAVYITHESREAAQKVVDHLLHRKCIACANVFPITSAYWWQGNISNDEEWVSIVKTTSENWAWLEREVSSIHPYDVPCIMKMEVEANQAYEAWIHNEVQKEHPIP